MAEVPAPEAQINGGGTVALNNPSELTGSKRHRRPSVRLGDIGVQPNDPHPLRRNAKPWRLPFPNASGKHSKTRPLTNLIEIDHRERGNAKKRGSSSSAAKRPRSNWVAASRIDEGEDDRDFDAGSPIHSTENLGDADEDDDYREVLQCFDEGNVRDRNGNDGRVRHGEDDGGVRIWLNGLGLGRYAPVFQIHEVDDEVLPLLTLEDLKDMGVNAVGSRRKLYCAIQKLGKGL